MVCKEETAIFVLDTPIGDIELVLCPEGLHSTKLMMLTDDDFCPDMTKLVVLKMSECTASPDDERFHFRLEKAVSWFSLYFSCPSLLESYGLPPLCMNSLNGKFCQDVWLTLASNVHSGKTITYGELAVLVGHKGAAQAVGQAMALNPFTLIVPCHRVIPRSGKVGEYSRGTKNKIKAWLLDFECAR